MGKVSFPVSTKESVIISKREEREKPGACLDRSRSV